MEVTSHMEDDDSHENIHQEISRTTLYRLKKLIKLDEDHSIIEVSMHSWEQYIMKTKLNWMQAERFINE